MYSFVFIESMCIFSEICFILGTYLRNYAAISDLHFPNCSDDARINSSKRISGPLAQLVEQWTFNPLVVGSSPTGPTVSLIAKICLSVRICKRIEAQDKASM